MGVPSKEVVHLAFPPHFRASKFWSMLHHGSVGVSSEWNERNLTLTLTLNLALPSIILHNKICVFITIFTALSFYALFLYKKHCQLDYMKMFKVPTLNKKKKEKDNIKKWKGFSVSLNRFELDDVSD